MLKNADKVLLAQYSHRYGRQRWACIGYHEKYTPEVWEPSEDGFRRDYYVPAKSETIPDLVEVGDVQYTDVTDMYNNCVAVNRPAMLYNLKHASVHKVDYIDLLKKGASKAVPVKKFIPETTGWDTPPVFFILLDGYWYVQHGHDLDENLSRYENFLLDVIEGYIPEVKEV